MIENNCCPQCGAKLSTNSSPEGLCPKCLLALAMADSQTDNTDGNIESGTALSKIDGNALHKLIGRVLDGKYRLDKQLGQGGMGAVYLATHLGTDRPVAIKVIAPQFMSNEEFVERFKVEAKATGRLRHPNIVNVTDFGFASVGADRMAYLVMEYLNGCTLGNLMEKEGPLPLGFVVDIVEQICSAIYEAHQRGIIHRDLKPDNIWMEPNARGGYNVKVLDFGLAKLRDVIPSDLSNERAMSAEGMKSVVPSAVTMIKPRDVNLEGSSQKEFGVGIDEEKRLAEEEKTRSINRGATAGTIDPRTVPQWLTRAGTVLGTPLYMSPEQCRGEVLDARSDIYSLGVVVYQMLTGETPFKGNDIYRLIELHLEVPPPPLKTKRPDIPESVSAFIMSALSKSPDGRISSAAAFANALRVRAESSGALLRQAIALCTDHYATFLRVSLPGNIPLIAAGIYSLSIPIMKTLPINFYFIPLIVISLLGMFAGWVNAGVLVPTAAHFLVTPLRSLEIRPLFDLFKKRLRPLIKTSLLANEPTLYLMGYWLGVYLYVFLWPHIYRWIQQNWVNAPLIIDVLPFLFLFVFLIPALKSRRTNTTGNQFYASVVVMERLEGRAAIARTNMLHGLVKDTVKSVRSISYLRMLPFYLIFLLMPFAANSSKDIHNYIIPLMIGLFLLLSIFLGPLNGVLNALIYFKARQAGGETLKEIVDSQSNMGLRQ